MPLFLKILTISYALCGTVTILAYVPTIRDLLSGKPSANVQTYVLWSLTTLLATLYGSFVVRDAVFVIVSGVQFFACTIVLILRIRLALIQRADIAKNPLVRYNSPPVH